MRGSSPRMTWRGDANQRKGRSMTGIPPELANSLAPTGRLRAAINLGNPVLAQRDVDGRVQGVTAELARELGRRARLAGELVTFGAAGTVFAALQRCRCDGAVL